MNVVARPQTRHSRIRCVKHDNIRKLFAKERCAVVSYIGSYPIAFN